MENWFKGESTKSDNPSLSDNKNETVFTPADVLTTKRDKFGITMNEADRNIENTQNLDFIKRDTHAQTNLNPPTLNRDIFNKFDFLAGGVNLNQDEPKFYDAHDSDQQKDQENLKLKEQWGKYENKSPIKGVEFVEKPAFSHSPLRVQKIDSAPLSESPTRNNIFEQYYDTTESEIKKSNAQDSVHVTQSPRKLSRFEENPHVFRSPARIIKAENSHVAHSPKRDLKADTFSSMAKSQINVDNSSCATRSPMRLSRINDSAQLTRSPMRIQKINDSSSVTRSPMRIQKHDETRHATKSPTKASKLEDSLQSTGSPFKFPKVDILAQVSKSPLKTALLSPANTRVSPSKLSGDKIARGNESPIISLENELFEKNNHIPEKKIKLESTHNQNFTKTDSPCLKHDKSPSPTNYIKSPLKTEAISVKKSPMKELDKNEPSSQSSVKRDDDAPNSDIEKEIPMKEEPCVEKSPEVSQRKRKRYSNVNSSIKKRKLSLPAKSRESSIFSPRSRDSTLLLNTTFNNLEYQDWKNFKPGDIYAIGQNEMGQLGLGEEVEELKTPRKIELKGQFVQISCGGMHSLALSNDRKVYSCGCNDEWALGRKSTEKTEKIFTPIKMDSKIVKVCAGDSFSAALSETGVVYAWGLFRDSNGPIGLIDSNVKENPLVIYERVDKATNIAAGSNHLLILTESGKIYSCGSGDEGQLGRITARAANSRGGRHSIKILVTPAEVFLPISYKYRKKGDFSKKAIRIFCTKNSSYCVTLDGTMYGWGLNNHGQVCEGDDFIFHPLEMKIDVGKDLTISGGVNHVLILNDDKVLYSFGDKADGALGRKNEEYIGVVMKDVEVCGCGDCCSFAVDTKGKLYSWGVNCNQQLGFDSDQDVQLPALVENIVNVIQISSGSQHTLLLCSK